MASTYSGNLAIELIGTGDQAGTWGATTNTNLGTALEQAITSTASVTFTAGGNTAIALAQTNAFQAARSYRLNFTGSATATQYLWIPSISKAYIVNNGLSNAIIISNGSNGSGTGTTVTVPSGRSMMVYNDGTNIFQPFTYIDGLTTSNTSVINASTITTSNLTTSNLVQTINATNTLQTHSWSNGTFTFTAISGNYDNVSAGHIEFYTANAGTLTENLRISNTGALGLKGTNYGTSGQVLTSSGANAAPTWAAGGISAGKSIALAIVFGF
jgi:hypothetical protein